MIIEVHDNHRGHKKGSVGWLQGEIQGVEIEDGEVGMGTAVLVLRCGERLPLVVSHPDMEGVKDVGERKYRVVSRRWDGEGGPTIGVEMSDSAWELCREIGEQVAEHMNNQEDREKVGSYEVQLQFIEGGVE